MKNNIWVIVAKIMAVINITIALVLLYTCYESIDDFYNSTEEFPSNYFIIIIPIIVLGILFIVGSLLFLFNKKAGWRLSAVFNLIIAIPGLYVVTEKFINTPQQHNLLTEIILEILFVLSAALLLSKPVRRHFKILKKSV
jgi:hypothetical protein